MRWLDEPGSLAELGGKGEGLARLTAAGLPVPAGFVLTTAAFALCRAAGEPDAVPPAVVDALRPAARALPLLRTLTVGPGVPPGPPLAGCERVADCHRRFGIAPTPERA